MSDIASPPAGGLVQQRPFALFWLARIAATIGYQMMALVIGWKIYEITGSAFDLGLVGLILFIPAVVLTLLIGHAADRYDRRLIVQLSQSVYALAAALVAVIIRPFCTPFARLRARLMLMQL
jgi:MFS family permease